MPSKQIIGIGLITSGAVVLIIGLVLGLVIPAMVQDKIESGIVSPDPEFDSQQDVENWKKNFQDDDPKRLVELYMYNITNPDEFKTGAAPAIVPVGPWVYWNQKLKFNVTVSGANREFVSYREWEEFVFQPELSKKEDGTQNSESDMIFSLQFVYVGILQRIQNQYLYPAILKYIYAFETTLFLATPSNCTVFRPFFLPAIHPDHETNDDAVDELLGRSIEAVRCRYQLRYDPDFRPLWKEFYELSGADALFFANAAPTAISSLLDVFEDRIPALVGLNIASNARMGFFVDLYEQDVDDLPALGSVGVCAAVPSYPVPSNALLPALAACITQNFGNFMNQYTVDISNALGAYTGTNLVMSGIFTPDEIASRLSVLLNPAEAAPPTPPSWLTEKGGETWYAAGQLSSTQAGAVAKAYILATMGIDDAKFQDLFDYFIEHGFTPISKVASYGPVFGPLRSQLISIPLDRLDAVNSNDMLMFHLGSLALTAPPNGEGARISFMDTEQFQTLKADEPAAAAIPDDFTNFELFAFLRNVVVESEASPFYNARSFFNAWFDGTYRAFTVHDTKAIYALLTSPDFVSETLGAVGAANIFISRVGNIIASSIGLGLLNEDIATSCHYAYPDLDANNIAEVAQNFVFLAYGIDDCRTALSGRLALVNSAAVPLFGAYLTILDGVLGAATEYFENNDVPLDTFGPNGIFPSDKIRSGFYMLTIINYVQEHIIKIVGCQLTCNNKNDGLVVHRSVIDFISGHHSALVAAVTGGESTTATGFYWDRFETFENSWEVRRNHTYYRGNTGATLFKIGHYHLYNEWSSLPAAWYPKADYYGRNDLLEVNGADGLSFPPAARTRVLVDVKKPRFDTYEVFIPRGNRRFRIHYVQDRDVKGIHTNLFEVKANDLSIEDGNDGNNYIYENPWDGVQSVSKQMPFPAFVSRPDFLYADPDLLALFPHLNPTKARHDSYLAVEPITGVTMDARLRFAAHLGIDKQFVTKSTQLAFGITINPAYVIDWAKDRSAGDSENKVIPFPFYYLSDQSTITDAQASQFKDQIYAAARGAYAALIIGPTLGTILAIIGAVLIVLHRKQSGGVGKTSSTAEMLKSPAFAPEVNNPVFYN